MKDTKAKTKDIVDVYPMNDIQKGMVLLSMMNPEGAVYHDQFLYVVPRVRNHENMIRALELMIERHPVLRTGFDMDNHQEEVQIVYESVEPVVEFEDLTDREHEEKEEYIKSKMAQDRMKIMKFRYPPLWKINVFHFDEEDSVYLIQFHHAVLDGWSLASFNTQLFNFYHELEKNPNYKPTPLEASFKDIVVEELAEKENPDTIAYWKKKLYRFNRIDIFRNDRIPTPEDGLRRLGIGLEKSKKVKEKAKKEELHYRNVMFGAFAFAIKMLTLENDFVIGVVSNNRPAIEGGDEVLGCFLNTLPLRLQFDQAFTNTWISYFKWVDKEMLELKTKDRSTLLEISKIASERQGNENPFFDILFNHVDFYNVYKSINDSNPMEVFSQKRKLKTRNFEMTNTFLDVMFIDAMDGELLMEYILNKEFKSGLSLDRLHEYICNILDKYLHEADKSIDASAVLSATERKSLLSTFSNTFQEPSLFTSVLNLFSAQVKENANKKILICQNQAHTYQELDVITNQFAQYLKEHLHIQPGDVVGIKLERSEWMVIAILSIWKIHAAYLPMDTSYPEKRIWYMEENSDCKVILDDRSIADFRKKQSTYNTSFQPEPLAEDQLAYLIYTSGSTGKPKGVMIEHGSLSNFMLGMANVLGVTSDDHLLALTSISFDISILELFWTLCNGVKTTIKKNNGEYFGFDQLLEKNDQVDFSLFYFSSQTSDEQNKYELVMQSAKFADEHQFKALWLPERHFHEFGGIFPNPSVLAASVATISKQIAIRSGSVVLPLHDTIRVAEEWSVVDNISRGRVGLSIASGWHVDDFVLQPENYKKRHEIMYEQIEELRGIWRGDSVRRLNGNAKSVELDIYPKPIQSELPIWITSAGHIDTFRTAGKIGANILTHMLGQDMPALEEKIAAYREELAKNGFDPEQGEVTLMLHTYIGKDLDSVQEVVKEPFKNYLRSSIGLVKNLLKGMGVENANLEADEMEDLLEMVFQRYWKTSALFGTVESCRKLVRKLKSIGVTEIGCLIDFGIDLNLVLAGLPELNELKDEFTTSSKTAPTSAEDAITAIQITPSYLSALLEDKASHAFIKSLKHLVVGGESFPENLKEKLLNMTEANIYNMYGPTETTIWSAVQPIQSADINRIGKPILNTRIYILNKQLELCPTGVVGELYIGGKGLARGYKNNLKATEEKFISSPFHPGEKIYNTGDLARWLPDGTLEFFGRSDRQIKIRGHRIELAEIEYHLNKQPTIEQSAVIVRQTEAHEELVAYFTSGSPQDASELRAYLSKNIPAYMIPAQFIQIDRIPTTANGKLDKRSLLTMETTSLSAEATVVVPRNDLEKEMIAIWEEILSRKNIGIEDNFFDVGGNSLNVVRLRRMLKERLDISINIADLFNHTTITAVSKLVNSEWEVTTKIASNTADTLEF